MAVSLSLTAAGQGDEKATLVKIFTTRALWGKDSPAALAFLPAWRRIGERTIAIFPDRIVGATPFKTAEEAQQARATVDRAFTERPPIAPEFEELLARFTREPAPFQAAVIRFLEDDSFRIALTAPNLQFLPESLTVRQVEELIGQPETVTTQVIQSERDRRPLVLTLHSYAKGAIVYAESDWAPRPGFVDRVILNVPAVTAVVFRGAQ
jgi:hypothetical protein